MKPLAAPQRPCSTCPYRKDTPPGIWDESEYEKLRTYDNDYAPNLAVFLCHQSNATGEPTACRGWLAVHPDHVAVRLAIISGAITPDDAYAECPVEVYGSGNEAADAGIAGVAEPTDEAKARIAALIRKRAGR